MSGKTKKKGHTIGRKMFVFVIVTVLVVALGTTVLGYFINVQQIDTYFKRLAKNSAQNFATMVDPQYLSKLRTAAETEEFQKIREDAENDDVEEPVEEYLKKENLWDEYIDTRDRLRSYIGSMKDIKYLYIIVWGDKNAEYDMYLIDADDVPITQTGYYEEREAEFEGANPEKDIEPTISHGDWGWLCSAYAPVYDSNGNLICHIGCDVGMDEIMSERMRNLTYMMLSGVGITALVLVGAVLFSKKFIIKPLDSITDEMKKFDPAENISYEDAGVMNLDIHSGDEIEDIYNGIRSMQINIIDHLNNISSMQKDKERAENDIRNKDKMIGQISQEAYRDSLTTVGNKAAYVKKVDELKAAIENGEKDIALVMVDINDLKKINDMHGHNTGDLYIKGCSHIICDIYKHSPVYRIGGDEFIAVLRGEDYNNRQMLFSTLKGKFKQTFLDENAQPWQRYSAAAGMAEYASDDNSVELIFKRADKEMYEDKTAFKEQYGNYR